MRVVICRLSTAAYSGKAVSEDVFSSVSLSMWNSINKRVARVKADFLKYKVLKTFSQHVPQTYLIHHHIDFFLLQTLYGLIQGLTYNFHI